MQPSLSVFLDARTGGSLTSRALFAQWLDAAAQRGDIEVLAASQFDLALAQANAPALAWLDAALPPRRALADACRAAALMQQSGAAAASLSPLAAGLSILGAPTSAPSTAVGTMVLIPTARAAVFDRSRIDALSSIREGFAPYSDADIGWRLALRGLSVVQASPLEGAPSRTAASPIDSAREQKQAITNQLRTLFTCAGEQWLRRALPAALARIIALAAAHATLDPRRFDFGAPPPTDLTLAVASVALLLAIEDFARTLPDLQTRRQHVQRTRTRDDHEILPLFDRTAVDSDWRDVSGGGADALCRILGVYDLLTPPTRPSTARAVPPRGTRLGISTKPSSDPTEDIPGVSIIILTRLGPTHLPACLAALAALEYPTSRLDVIVVDNASAVDPSPIVEQRYPAARLLRQTRNLGFCGGNNAGVASARHDWLLFLNDDTRVDSELLQQLFATIRRRGARSAGALVTDWDGDRVDFGGGGMNFEARGFQHGVGDPNVAAWAVERPLLFANGAALLVHRSAFEAAGGFPEAYFAYYEDLALGWALWLIGEEVWLSPDARLRHRHHGTSAESSRAARVRNCERNALYTLLTHMGDEGLGDVLAASLTLAATRIVLGLGLGGFRADALTTEGERRLRMNDRFSPRVLAAHTKAELLRRGAARSHGLLGSARRVGVRGLAGTVRSLSHLIRWGGPPPARGPRPSDSYPIEPVDAAALAAAAEWCANADRMESARGHLQSMRQRSDYEIISRFSDNWLHAVPVDPSRQAEYEATHRIVANAFRLERFASA